MFRNETELRYGFGPYVKEGYTLDGASACRSVVAAAAEHHTAPAMRCGLRACASPPGAMPPPSWLLIEPSRLQDGAPLVPVLNMPASAMRDLRAPYRFINE